MKVELCVIGALILLSSITSIFNNLVVVDTSAQPMEKVAYGYDQSYNDDGYAAKNSYNNMDDKYSKHPSQDNKYECQRGPFQGFFVESVEFCDVKFHDKSHQDRKGDTPSNGEATCLKCADLAILVGGNGPQVQGALGLIGTSTDNIFTVCEDADPRDGFADLISDVPGDGGVMDPQSRMNAAFDECLVNTASLQDSSLTTNVQAESAIP